MKMSQQKRFAVSAQEGSLPDFSSKYNVLDDEGLSAIHYAALTGKTKPVETLLDWGAQPDKLSEDSLTGFDMALDHHYFEICDIFLTKGECLEPRPCGYNALDYPAMQNDRQALEYLLRIGAHPNGTNDLRAPLVWAVQEDSHDAVLLLLKAGADALKVDVETDDQTALSLAAADGNTELLAILVKFLKISNETNAKHVAVKYAHSLALTYGETECAELIHRELM